MTQRQPAHQAAVPAFDGVRATVQPGEHVVGRYPGVLIVIRRDAPEAEGRIAQLLELCREATAVAPRAPGRPLARRLTGWLAQADDAPGFGTVAATEDGLAVFLYGAVTVTIPTQNLQLAGRTAAFSVDRLIDWPEGVVSLRADSSDSSDETASDDLPDWFGFRLGVVAGAGVLLHAGAAHTVLPGAASPPAAGKAAGEPAAGTAADELVDEPAAGPAHDKPESAAQPADARRPAEPDRRREPDAPEASADPEPQTSAEGISAAPPPPDREVQGLAQLAPPPPPAVFDQIRGVAPDEPQRPPLAVAYAPAPQPGQAQPGQPQPGQPQPGQAAGPGRPPAPPTGFLPTPPPQDEGTVVLGFRCSREHLNDPRVSFCATCGIRMDQRTGVLVRGRRPPLGLIVLDTGSTFVLDDDYLLGRDPEHDADVQGGRLRPLRLDDNSGTLSRAHVEIRLHDWDVTLVDRGSANGTFVAAPQQQAWVAVVPGQPFALTAGSQIGIGRRTFTFESPHGRL